MEEDRLETEIIESCSYFDAEKLGIYLLRCLKQLNGERGGRKVIAENQKTYENLLNLFRRKLKARRNNLLSKNSLSKKERMQADLAPLLESINRKYKEVFISRKKAPIKKHEERIIKLTSPRSRLVSIDSNCINCSVILKQGWQYHTDAGDVYFCSTCKNNVVKPVINPGKVDMWSRMTFSAFESNRRKH